MSKSKRSKWSVKQVEVVLQQVQTNIESKNKQKLEAPELVEATAGFVESRLIGRGGFGQVFLGEALPSLAAHGWDRVAVKRADVSKLELADLTKEVTILRRCDHPHLLPLLGYWYRRGTVHARPRRVHARLGLSGAEAEFLAETNLR